MNAITYNFTDVIQEYAAQNEWGIAEIDEKHAIFQFTMESGRKQILYIYKYGSVLEFSVPSLARFESETEIFDQLSISLLIRNSQKKIGFWCIEKIGEKLVFSFMHNIELRLLDLESFSEILRILVQECDYFESCLLENEQQNSAIQQSGFIEDILSYRVTPESSTECFREISYSKHDWRSGEEKSELQVYHREGDSEDGIRLVNQNKQTSSSQIDISNISFERVGNFSEFIRELKNLNRELAKSDDENIRQANNEIREAIQEADQPQPNFQVIWEKLKVAWERTRKVPIIQGLIATAILMFPKMVKGRPLP